MANEQAGKGGKALKVLPPGQEVERATVAPDGTVTVAHARGKLVSVDIADVDLLLSFSDGSFVIVPNGALDALAGDSRNVVFPDAKVPLAQVFKLAGIANPAKAGSLRLVSEAIDSAKPPADEAPPPEETIVEPPAPPAPMVKVSAGTSPGNKGAGKGPGAGGSGSGEGEGEVPATVTPLQSPIPPVFRVGQKREGVLDVLTQFGLTPPSFTTDYGGFFTSAQFKLTPSGRSDAPLGSFVPGMTTAAATAAASPARQATVEIINGTAGDDNIGHNALFSTSTAQFAKSFHGSLNGFALVSEILITATAAQIAKIPGFDLIGTGVSKVAGKANQWTITPTDAMLQDGLDFQIVYNVFKDGDPDPGNVDFGMDVTVSGLAGPFSFEVTANLDFSWRPAVTALDYQTAVNSAGDPLMVLPRDGVGAEIFAGDGNDTVNAGAGHDLIHGGNGNDVLFGGTGNDTLDGGDGADELFGGLGTDTATYKDAPGAVTARLDIDGSNSGWAAGDQLASHSIENLTGSDYADRLHGDNANNLLDGGLGDDTLIGGTGANTLSGGAPVIDSGGITIDGGNDTASYEFNTSASVGITASLTIYDSTGALRPNEGFASDNTGSISDRLLYIENLIGGAGNDVFTGAAGVHANAFDGRAGSDTVSYYLSTAGVVAALDSGLLTVTPPGPTSDDATGDTFTNIENLTGSAFADRLFGDGNANVLSGGLGNDTLEGLGGADQFLGGADNDTVSYQNSVAPVRVSLTLPANLFYGAAFTADGDAIGDTFSSIENLIGTGGADVLYGNNLENVLEGGVGDDTLQGLAGGDTLRGGDGSDTASYAHSSGVLATLTTGLAGVNASGDAGGDFYENIENLLGSEFTDTLIGDGSHNRLSGGNGNDVLIGMGGTDTLDGGTGNNTASYAYASSGVGASLAALGGLAGGGEAEGDVFVAGTIQNLTGSDYADTLVGDGVANVLSGGAGNDTLTGGAGNDTLIGGADNDELSDDMIGVNELVGGAGDDILILTGFDVAGDRLFGDDGIDTIVMNTATAYTWYINMGAQPANSQPSGTFYTTTHGSGNTTTFFTVENFTMTGANVAYVYVGNTDNRLIGGSTGNDQLDFRHAVAGVQVDLRIADGSQNVWGGSGNDTVTGFEHIGVGTQWNDLLIGNGANNTIRGYYGNDTIDGQGGTDTWLIDWSGNPVTASLLTAAQNAAMGIVMTGDAAGDTVLNMENLQAYYSQGAGYGIYGTGIANSLYGNSLIEGFAGADYLYGWLAGATASYANAGNSYLFGQGVTSTNGVGVTATLTAGLSRYDGVAGTITGTGDAAGDTYNNVLNNLRGSEFADTLIGNASANTLTGGAGDDLLEGLAGGDLFQGGSGIDTVTYFHSTAGVVADLRGVLLGTNDAFGDVFSSIENLTGSSFNDSLYGDNGDNVLVGGLGNDLLDGGFGSDTASYAGVAGNLTINLATGIVSGAAGTDTLVGIEYVIGGSGNDSITGTDAADSLSGGAGIDTIIGGLGDDTLDGGAGGDSIDGGGGNNTVSYASAGSFRTVTLAGPAPHSSDGDTLTGIQNIIGSDYGDVLTGDGNDNVIEGGLGNDNLDGGTGSDTASYAGASAAVTVSLATGVATGGAGNDTLTGFENLRGSAYSDSLTGDSVANRLEGGDGNDTLVGGDGGDTLIGGAGIDTVSYAGASAGVAVTINGAGTAGDAIGDLLVGIENLIGSDHLDTLTGDGGSNLFVGGLGNDIINGGAGNDTVSYAAASGAVTVDLSGGGANVSGADGADQLSNIENIIGSDHADSLTGDGENNLFVGGLGNDTIRGGLGNDTIEGGAGDDILSGWLAGPGVETGAGVDTASYAGASAAVTVSLAITGAQNTGGAGTDTLTYFENLLGSAFNDQLTGDGSVNVLDGGAGDDTLIGGAGGDQLIGGAGNDTASYATSITNVTASLTTNTGTLGDANGDTFSGIENLTGGSGNDSLTGDSLANILTGGGGNDTLTGNDGNDRLDLSLGRDNASGGNGDDTFWLNVSGSDGTAVHGNLPTLADGGGNNSPITLNGGDTIKLFGLGATYSLTTLAGVTNNMEILDIREGTPTTLNFLSADIRAYVDGGNGSQIWIRADTTDSINWTRVTNAGETVRTDAIGNGMTDYTIYNSSGTQVAQIHWMAA